MRTYHSFLVTSNASATIDVLEAKYAELYKKKMNVPNSVELHFMAFPCFGGAICMGIQKKNQSHYAVNSCHYSNNG